MDEHVAVAGVTCVVRAFVGRSGQAPSDGEGCEDDDAGAASLGDADVGGARRGTSWSTGSGDQSHSAVEEPAGVRHV